MSTLLTLLFMLSVGQASATQLLYSPDGGSDGSGAIDTALPLARIGTVTLQRGTFAIHGDSAAVTMVPEWQFDHHTVLKGRVLDTRKTAGGKSQGAPLTISGVIFFDSGEWINYFDDKAAVESISTDKDTVSGRITAISSLDVDVTQLNGQIIAIPLSTVLDIRSPRAFRFNIPLRGFSGIINFTQALELDANRVTVEQQGRTFRLAQLKTLVRRESQDGDFSTTKLAVMGTTVSLLNLAQLAPLLGIPLAHEPSLSRKAFLKEFNFNVPSFLPSNGGAGAAAAASSSAPAAVMAGAVAN